MLQAHAAKSGRRTRHPSTKSECGRLLLRVRALPKRSRTKLLTLCALTSGGLEPVSDSGGGSHSVFAKVFISLLEENTGVLNTQKLFTELRPRVMKNTRQTPEHGTIHLSGHDGGDFLFVRQ